MLSKIKNFLLPELKFGDFTFSHVELIGALPWGGRQKVVVHELIGGVRNVQAMGKSDASITFAGQFRGLTARDRAQFLNTQMVEGTVANLTWENFSYQCLITAFTCSDEGPVWPYTITFLPILDNNNPVTTAYPAFFDDTLFSYMDLALGLANIIADPTILTPLSLLNDMINSFSSSSGSQKGPTNSQAQNAQAQTNVVISAVKASRSTAISSAPPVTGDITGNYPAIAANTVLQTQLNQLLAVMTIINDNFSYYISPSSGSATTISVQNPDFYRLAVKYYGDHLLWTVIAQANGWYYPRLRGVYQITIPAVPGPSTGGLLLS